MTMSIMLNYAIKARVALNFQWQFKRAFRSEPNSGASCFMSIHQIHHCSQYITIPTFSCSWASGVNHKSKIHGDVWQLHEMIRQAGNVDNNRCQMFRKWIHVRSNSEIKQYETFADGWQNKRNNLTDARWTSMIIRHLMLIHHLTKIRMAFNEIPNWAFVRKWMAKQMEHAEWRGISLRTYHPTEQTKQTQIDLEHLCEYATSYSHIAWQRLRTEFNRNDDV